MSLYESWSAEDWMRHYAGPRFGPRSEVGSVWDEQGRRLPSEIVRYETGARIVMPEDVRQAKMRLDARYRSVEADVFDCIALDQAERRAFVLDMQAWRTFFCGTSAQCTEPKVGLIGIGAEMDQVQHYEKRLYEWQQKLKKKCSLGAPMSKPVEERSNLVPLLVAGGLAFAAYRFGPAIRRELFAPAVIQKDLVEKRRQRAKEVDENVAIEGKSRDAEIAERAGTTLGDAARTAGRVVGKATKLVNKATHSVEERFRQIADKAASK